jgi:hypothetical protein
VLSKDDLLKRCSSYVFSLSVLSLSVLSLSACGGGGGGSSPVPPVYSPVGVFGGPTTAVDGTPGNIGLDIASDGSGAFAAQYQGQQLVALSFTSAYGHVSGSDFTIPTAQFTLSGQPSGCTFALNGHMVSANEMDGSYTTVCGTQTGTIPFKISRQANQSQSIIRQDQAIPLQKI